MNLLKLFSQFAACTGSQIQTLSSGNCYPTNIPTVQATSNELQTILQVVFAIIGVLSVMFVVIGGFMYTVSGGDPGSIKKAKATIMYAVIGLVISILAETIVTFVLSFVK